MSGDACDFNNIETRAVIKFSFFLQGKALKEIHAILTEILACFISVRAKDLSATLYLDTTIHNRIVNLLHFSALIGHLQRGILQKQVYLLIRSAM